MYKKIFYLCLLSYSVLGLGLVGCATTWWSAEKVLPKPYDGTVSYQITNLENFKTESRIFDEIKMYYKDQPVWGPIKKVKRVPGKGISVADAVEHPYQWQRETTNEPLVLIKTRPGLMNIVIMVIPHGRDCAMNRYNLFQSTFSDATADPNIITDNKNVIAVGVREGSGDGFIDNYKVECDDYDKIQGVKIR